MTWWLRYVLGYRSHYLGFDLITNDLIWQLIIFHNNNVILDSLLEIIIENEDVCQVLNIDIRNFNSKITDILKYLVKNVEKFNG